MKLLVAVVAAASALSLTGCAGSTTPPSRPQQSTTSTVEPPTGTTATSAAPTATPRATTGPTASTSSAPTSTPSRSPSASPGSPAQLRPGRSAWVSVSVATVWRSPSSPRRVDAPALRSPAGIRSWLAAMTLADRRGLQGRADTQVLLGDRVQVTSIRGTWAHVVVPDQPTPLDSRGYPGWVPVRQLTSVAPPSTAESVTVVSRTSWLRSDSAAAARTVEVSHGTRLPLLGRRDTWVRVGLPGGVVRRIDAAAVVRHAVGAPARRPTSSSLVQSAQSFTGLPYLWAGRSGFGFDCSGLTSLVFRVHGIVIARDADAQAAGGRRASSRALAPGDLLFYATSSGYVHHVSMYAGSGLMVQSPATGRPVQTIAMSTPTYAAEYAGARRYLP